MAQTISTPKGSPANLFNAKNASVTVPATGNTTLLTLPVRGVTRIFVQLSVATQALDAFIIAAKAHPDATAITIASAAADFTGPADPIVDTSGDLTAIAASGAGWFVMNTAGMHEVTISASAAVDSAVVTIYAAGE